MSRIYFDSKLFIHWLEDHTQFAPRVGATHARMHSVACCTFSNHQPD